MCNSKQKRTGSSTQCLIRSVFIAGSALLFVLHSAHTPSFAWAVSSNIKRRGSFVQVKDFLVTLGDPHCTLMVCDWGGLKSGCVSLDVCERSLRA